MGWGGGGRGWSSGGWGGGWQSGDWDGGGKSGGSWSAGGCGNGGGGKTRSKGKGKRSQDKGGGSAAPFDPASSVVVDEAVAEKLGRMPVEFCPDPVTIGTRFTSTFDAETTACFGSLNAGDLKYMVGGGTLNKQFAKDLQTHGGQDPEFYMWLHQRAAKCAVEAGEAQKLVAAPPAVLKDDPNVAGCYVRLLEIEQKVGVVFIDIFKDACRPYQNSKNVAMVYTVGPSRKDCPSDAVFLEQVRAMAGNVSAACAEYNASGAKPPLEKLRVCLVSGGAFAGKVPKEEVAKAICVGLADGVDEKSSPVFEFAFDGDVFRATMEALCQK